VTLILDAGALLAVERGDREIVAAVGSERAAGRVPVTHGGIVGQVWRGGARQARLARLLPGLEVVALDERLGRAAGELLALSRGELSDAIDAALVVLAQDGDLVLTSDPEDIVRLAELARVEVDVARV
jgi:hypothetical protein